MRFCCGFSRNYFQGRLRGPWAGSLMVFPVQSKRGYFSILDFRFSIFYWLLAMGFRLTARTSESLGAGAVAML
jgi:hypothetical protein